MTLKAPFPYYGGKARLAPQIWERLGNPEVYVEPFAGSLACLLARPDGPGPREIVGDLDGGICNFWRAVTADPEQVAYHADYPTIHQDLTARHAWLQGWFVAHADQLSADPEFHDPKVAGWWVWGISIWIGGQWCHTAQDRRPDAGSGGGRGVSPRRVNIPDQRPRVADRGGGNGVSAQRTTRPALLDWFTQLQDRLSQVVVINRTWDKTLTRSLLQQTPTVKPATVGVMLDPPYLTEDRANSIYCSDADGTSDDVAAASWAWAVNHGHKHRIAYCAHQGDFQPPEGWTTIESSFGGVSDPDRKHRRDQVLFSPACQPGMTLFG